MKAHLLEKEKKNLKLTRRTWKKKEGIHAFTLNNSLTFCHCKIGGMSMINNNAIYADGDGRSFPVSSVGGSL